MCSKYTYWSQASEGTAPTDTPNFQTSLPIHFFQLPNVDYSIISLNLLESFTTFFCHIQNTTQILKISKQLNYQAMLPPTMLALHPSFFCQYHVIIPRRTLTILKFSRTWGVQEIVISKRIAEMWLLMRKESVTANMTSTTTTYRRCKETIFHFILSIWREMEFIKCKSTNREA